MPPLCSGSSSSFPRLSSVPLYALVCSVLHACVLFCSLLNDSPLVRLPFSFSFSFSNSPSLLLLLFHLPFSSPSRLLFSLTLSKLGSRARRLPLRQSTRIYFGSD